MPFSGADIAAVLLAAAATLAGGGLIRRISRRRSVSADASRNSAELSGETV